MLTSWLVKAADNRREQHLYFLGVLPEVVTWVITQPEEQQQQYVNALLKQPKLTPDQLSAAVPEQKSPYTEYERRVASRLPEWMADWILVQLRLMRLAPRKGDQSFYDPGVNYRYSIEHGELVNKLAQIADWVEQTHSHQVLPSINFDQARQRSDEWHQEMAGEGKGLEYEPIQEKHVEYGPKWKNPEWEGWTIQWVRSENDLLTEGNKMNHCVGGFCEEMTSGKAEFLSLRDPNNQPHITIRVNKEWQIEEIEGHSNSDPKPQYKEMISEWMQSDKNPLSAEIDDYINYDHIENANKLVNADRFFSMLPLMFRETIVGDLAEYGLPRSLPGNFDVERAFEAILEAIRYDTWTDGYHEYGSWMDEILRDLVNFAWQTDTDLLKTVEQKHSLGDPFEPNESQITKLGTIVEGIKARLREVTQQNTRWPQTYAYEDEEKFRKAIEKASNEAKQKMKKAYETTVPYAFVPPILQRIEELQKRWKVEHPFELVYDVRGEMAIESLSKNLRIREEERKAIEQYRQ